MSDEKISKLSGLGQALEVSLKTLLSQLDATETVLDADGKPMKGSDGKPIKRPKYSLVDKMRVYDRALKLEAIKAKLTDDDGAFFGQGADE